MCVCTGSLIWDNPRIVGTPYQDDDGQTSYEGPKIGSLHYSDLEEIKYLSFLKGASAIFTFRFEGIDIPPCHHTMKLETTQPSLVPDSNRLLACRSHASRQWKHSPMSQGGTGASCKSAKRRPWGPMFPVGHLCYCLITFPL